MKFYQKLIIVFIIKVEIKTQLLLLIKVQTTLNNFLK